LHALHLRIRIFLVIVIRVALQQKLLLCAALRPDFSTLCLNADVAVEESPRRICPLILDPELELISVFMGLLFLESDVQRTVLWNVSGELPTRPVQHSKQWPLL
jgi:hypothetical protein